MSKSWAVVAVMVVFAYTFASGADAPTKVHNLKITVLSTMLAELNELGEWGFSALVEADGHKFLFDTGMREDTVLQNVASMHIDISDVQDVILSHNHGDHTGGLIRLRREFKDKNPHALQRTHVAPQIFWQRSEGGLPWPNISQVKAGYESLGGSFELHSEPVELAPGVWFTGPIPRKYPERNFPPGVKVRKPDGSEVPDELPEDSALVINTDKGLVVISGCGHAGIVNTATYARQLLGKSPIAALIGGFHLFPANDSELKWTSAELGKLDVRRLLGAHCTGIEAVFQLRQQLGLDRKNAIVAAVGSIYTSEKGIEPGGLGLAR